MAGGILGQPVVTQQKKISGRDKKKDIASDIKAKYPVSSTPVGFTNNNPAQSDLIEYMKRAGQNLDEIQENSIQYSPSEKDFVFLEPNMTMPDPLWKQ